MTSPLLLKRSLRRFPSKSGFTPTTAPNTSTTGWSDCFASYTWRVHQVAPAPSNDNALVRTPRWCVAISATPTPARRHAALVNGFLRDVLAPYRTTIGHFPVTHEALPLRERTPYQLKSLDMEPDLRPGVTFGRTASLWRSTTSPPHDSSTRPATNCFATSSAVRPRRHERIVHRAESSGSQPHDKGRILWICGRVLRTGASPAGRVDSPWTTRTRCPPPAHTLAPLAHKLHRTNHR